MTDLPRLDDWITASPFDLVPKPQNRCPSKLVSDLLQMTLPTLRCVQWHSVHSPAEFYCSMLLPSSYLPSYRTSADLTPTSILSSEKQHTCHSPHIVPQLPLARLLSNVWLSPFLRVILVHPQQFQLRQYPIESRPPCKHCFAGPPASIVSRCLQILDRSHIPT